MIAAGSSLRGLSEVTIGAVGEPADDLAHQRALGAVAVAAAPEDADEPCRSSGRRASASTFSSASGVCA